MSKVYSFRLDTKNPREAQARKVIETWVSNGYSLRNMIVETLLSNNKPDYEHKEIYNLLEQIRKLISSQDKNLQPSTTTNTLPGSFVDSVKKSIRDGERIA
jgi:hypothetical protein